MISHIARTQVIKAIQYVKKQEQHKSMGLALETSCPFLNTISNQVKPLFYPIVKL